MDNAFYEQLCEQEQILVQEENSISASLQEVSEKLRVLREFKSSFFKNDEKIVDVDSKFINVLNLKVPANYTKKLVIPVKVLFALRAIDSGEVREIADKMVEFEPNYGLEKARKDVKHHISRLTRAGYVNVIRKGSGKRSGLYQYKKR